MITSDEIANLLKQVYISGVEEAIGKPSTWGDIKGLTRASNPFWCSKLHPSPFEACPTLEIPHDYQDPLADPAPRPRDLEGRS